MRCPYCGHAVTSVIDSRLSQESNTIRRRRECESCKRRFTTLESADLSFPRVIKSDKSTESFSKDKIKNYLHYLEKSAAADNIYPESALELAQHNKDDVETAISYYKLYAKNEPSQRTLAYNKIENILFDNQQYDDVEILYRELLEKSFDGFALNRLVDILLEKKEFIP